MLKWLSNIAIIGAGQAVVREAVFGILSAVGLSPIIMGVAGSAALTVWAWVSDKSALDITF